MPFCELSNVVDWSCKAGEAAMWTAVEPEILGTLSKVGVLKDSISCQRDIPMISLLSRRSSWWRTAGRTAGRKQPKKLDESKSRSTV